MRQKLTIFLNTYFFTGYLFILLVTVINMTTTSLLTITNITLDRILYFVQSVFGIIFLPIFNSSLISFPSQYYSGTPAIPETLFYFILITISIIYILQLESLRNIIKSLFNKKFESGTISKSLLKIAIYSASIFLIAVTTEIVQYSVVDGFSFEIINATLTGISMGSISITVIALVIRLIIKQQIKLQEEVDSII